MTADRNAGIFASSTETPPRSRSRIFTYRKMKIATSPFVYRGAHVFMPEKLGNLQLRELLRAPRGGGERFGDDLLERRDV
jgi:hypothetical protein